MPKQNQSETLSLPQLLQLAGIGGQPQQDTTREALGYMMGQQRIASEDADRKVKMQQAEQENAYRMKALEQQMGQKDDAEKVRAASTILASSTNPEERAFAMSLLGYAPNGATASPDAAAAERNRLSLEEARKRNASFQEATSARNLGATVKNVFGLLHSPQKTSEAVVNNFGEFWGPTVDEFTTGMTGNPTGPEQDAMTRAAIAKHYSGLPTTNMPPLQLQGLASQLGPEVPQNVLNSLTPAQMQELLKTVTVAKPNQTLSFQP